MFLEGGSGFVVVFDGSTVRRWAECLDAKPSDATKPAFGGLCQLRLGRGDFNSRLTLIFKAVVSKLSYCCHSDDHPCCVSPDRHEAIHQQDEASCSSLTGKHSLRLTRIQPKRAKLRIAEAIASRLTSLSQDFFQANTKSKTSRSGTVVRF